MIYLTIILFGIFIITINIRLTSIEKEIHNGFTEIIRCLKMLPWKGKDI